MIGISDLNGGDHARLQEILLGRSEFAAFRTNGFGRPLHVWIMTDAALANVEASMGARASAPPEPEPEAEGPPPARVVPIAHGVHDARPGGKG